MTMRTHELHPAIVHAPLALLPAAAIVDLVAVLAARERGLDRLGRTLWWSTAGSALLAGLAGMAASQEIELPDDHARDTMFLHGIGNVTLLAAAAGVASWRARHRASVASACAGLGAAAAAMYTAYLGGELVYTHGAGVKRLGGQAAEAPALFSGEGVARLGRDAIRGMGWLLRRASRAASGKERVDRTALGPIGELGTRAQPVH